MTKHSWLWPIRLVAVVGGLSLTHPVSAAVSFAYGDAGSSSTVLGFFNGGDSPLQIGHNSDSYYVYYYTCDVGCGGPYGGSVLDTSWSIDIAGNSLDYKFNAFEGTDSGSVSAHLSTFLFFHTDRKPLVYTSQSETATPPGPDCVECDGALGLQVGSEPDYENGYDVGIFVDSNAFVSYGGNQVNHDLHIFISEVPEPMTWEVILAGFAAIGAALRFRPKRPAAAFRGQAA